jgi:hypothetical protein
LCIYYYFICAFLALYVTLLKLQISFYRLRKLCILQYKLFVKVLHKLLDSLSVSLSDVIHTSRFLFILRFIFLQIVCCCLKFCLINLKFCYVAYLRLIFPCLWPRFRSFNCKWDFGVLLNLGLSRLILFNLRTWISTSTTFTFPYYLFAQHWSSQTWRLSLMLWCW